MILNNSKIIVYFQSYKRNAVSDDTYPQMTQVKHVNESLKLQ